MTDLATQVAAAPWLTSAVRGLPPHRGPMSFSELQDLAQPQRALHLNESPYPPSPKAIAAVREALQHLNRYPESRARALTAAIAERTGVAATNIVYGVGSDELIDVIAEMTLMPGRRCVLPSPCFPRYAVSARLRDAVIVKVPVDAAGACNAAGLVAAIDDNTPLVYACTPNAPTGGLMSAAALTALIAGVPSTTLLVIDEAYHEFGRHAGGPDVLAALALRRGPWIVLRTFSKAYCLAGLRIGYALCGSAVEAEGLRRTKLHYNITDIAQAAALAAYRDDDYLRTTLDAITRERERLAIGLRDLQLPVYPSAANFVSADLGIPALPVMQAMAERGIHVRDWRDPGYPTQLRIAVGLPADTDAVLHALPAVLRGAAR